MTHWYIIRIMRKKKKNRGIIKTYELTPCLLGDHDEKQNLTFHVKKSRIEKVKDFGNFTNIEAYKGDNKNDTGNTLFCYQRRGK